VPLGVPDPLGIGPSGIGEGPPTPMAAAIAIENPKDGFPALNDVFSAPHFLHRATPLASDDVCCMLQVAAQRSAAQAAHALRCRLHLLRASHRIVTGSTCQGDAQVCHWQGAHGA
jgi:hypothetical protein